PPFAPSRTGGRALGQRGRGDLGVPPRRRTDAQLPVLLLGTLGHLPPPQVTPQRDQQLPRQRHDADLPRPLIPRAEAALVPLAQGARRLPAPPQPGQLHDQAAHVLVARLADPLLPCPPRPLPPAWAAGLSPTNPPSPWPWRRPRQPNSPSPKPQPPRPPPASTPSSRRTWSRWASSPPRSRRSCSLAASRTCRCS